MGKQLCEYKTCTKEATTNEKITTVGFLETNATITFHSKKRYVERVLLIPEEESVEYVNRNTDRVNQQMKELVKGSSLLYTGYPVPQMNGVAVYIFMNREIILIFTNNFVLKTIWKNQYQTDFAHTVAEVRKQIDVNKDKYKILEKENKIIGRRGDQIEFAIEQLKGLSLKSAEIDSKIELLEKERLEQRRQGAANCQMIKGLKEENRRMVKSIMYGFIE